MASLDVLPLTVYVMHTVYLLHWLDGRFRQLNSIQGLLELVHDLPASAGGHGNGVKLLDNKLLQTRVWLVRWLVVSCLLTQHIVHLVMATPSAPPLQFETPPPSYNSQMEGHVDLAQEPVPPPYNPSVLSGTLRRVRGAGKMQ